MAVPDTIGVDVLSRFRWLAPDQPHGESAIIYLADGSVGPAFILNALEALGPDEVVTGWEATMSGLVADLQWKMSIVKKMNLRQADIEVKGSAGADLAQGLLEDVQDLLLIPRDAGPVDVLGAVERKALEALTTYWQRHAADFATGSDLATGDLLVVQVEELKRLDRPPRRVLRAMAGWFLEKANLFVDEAAKSAGKAVGPAVVVATAKATGSWEELHRFATEALGALKG